jgi:hypothetical protein
MGQSPNLRLADFHRTLEGLLCNSVPVKWLRFQEMSLALQRFDDQRRGSGLEYGPVDDVARLSWGKIVASPRSYSYRAIHSLPRSEQIPFRHLMLGITPLDDLASDAR